MVAEPQGELGNLCNLLDQLVTDAKCCKAEHKASLHGNFLCIVVVDVADDQSRLQILPRKDARMSVDDPKTDLPADDMQPIFVKDSEKLPWSPADALPIDDDGNILPGNDPQDDDPNDNGDQENAYPEDLPGGAGRHLDPNMSKTDLLP